ncbi:MAG: tryptophan--tRNA ligase [Planctomycetota bacterium]|jgi:tryptophanyl-tRNA synthetase
MTTVLTGLKPTGSPHLGNYVGMLKPALAALGEYADARFLYFIADYHALTTLREPESFRRLCYEATATWLALGLDAGETVLYRQSDVPEVFELTWLLACVTPKGLMNRAHAYKAAVAENLERGATDEDAGVNMGLYNYPILMAADILVFQTDLVPVGADQAQHVEIARDIAAAFNNAYGHTFHLPRHVIREEVGGLPGLDGRKMSASYGNTIPLFADREELRDLIFRIKTDSTPIDAPKDPATSTLFLLYKEFASPQEVERMRARYLDGTISWAEAKQELFESMDAFLAGPRESYQNLMADTDRLDAVLADGANKARALARPTMERAREAVGRA